MTSFNQAATDILGYSALAALGQPIEQLLPAAGDTPNLLRQMLLSHVSLHRHELQVTTQNGELVYLGLSTSPLLNAQNEMIGALAAFTDLSPIRALEEEKGRLDRLAIIGQMAAGIAHEIRNPLAAIKTGVQVLGWGLTHDPPALESVHIINGEIDRLDGIIKELLAFARPRQMQLADVDLCDIVAQVLQVLHPQLQAAHVEVNRCCTEPLRLNADEDQLKQVLINLILNAIQAMPGGGQLFIQGTRGVPQGIVLHIRDTGSGIAADVVDNIFAPFFTTKSHGIGLGLAISRRVIEEHGGAISVESQPGEGTTFTIILPAPKTNRATKPERAKRIGKMP